MRVSTTIDAAALPDSIDAPRFERDLYESAGAETRADYDALYRLNPDTSYNFV